MPPVKPGLARARVNSAADGLELEPQEGSSLRGVVDYLRREEMERAVVFFEAGGELKRNCCLMGASLLGKQSACSAGDTRDTSLIPGEGNGNPLQYSCLGNAMDRRAWWATVYGLARVRCNLAAKTMLLYERTEEL